MQADHLIVSDLILILSLNFWDLNYTSVIRVQLIQNQINFFLGELDVCVTLEFIHRHEIFHKAISSTETQQLFIFLAIQSIIGGLLKEKDVQTIRLDIVSEFLQCWFGPSFNTLQVLTGFSQVKIFNSPLKIYLSGS